MTNLLTFAKHLIVLLLSRSYLRPFCFGEYLAGFYHLIGVKVPFAAPRIICIEPDNHFSPSLNFLADSGGVTHSHPPLLCCQKYSDIISFAVDDRSPTALVFDDAIITNQYGIHDLHGNPVLGSVVIRGDLTDASSYPDGYPRRVNLRGALNPCSKLQEIPLAFYITFLAFNHIGHELTEVVSAIHPLLVLKKQGWDISSLKIIVHNPHPRYLEILSRIFDLDENQILVPGANCGALLVKTAVFASPSFVLKSFVLPSHHLYVKQYLSLAYEQPCVSVPAILKNAHEKIYISRSRLGFLQRQFLQEKDLERELRVLGWMIFHPQDFPVQDQLQVLNRASFLCSLEGSALHLVMGVDACKLRQVFLLSEKKTNDFVLQFISQDISCFVFECLERDIYPPFVRNNTNVRLKSEFDVQSLARVIDDRASSSSES